MTTQTDTTVSVAGRRNVMKRTKFIVIALAVAGAIFGSLALPARSSQAFTFHGGGVPGAVGFSTQVYGWSRLDRGTGIQFGTSYAYRAPTNYYATQRICAEFLVWRSTGGTRYANNVGWIREIDQSGNDGPWCGNFAPGQGPAMFPAVLHGGTPGFIYTTAILFTWQVNGQYVGWRVVDYSQPSDYQCNAAFVNNVCYLTTYLGRGSMFLNH